MPETDFPPPLSCDCHTHVIGPKSRYSLTCPRAYTPADAPLAALEKMLAGLGIERVVLVQTSVFGTDNACMQDALNQLGDHRARGVAVPKPNLPGNELDALHASGVRGIRVNMATLGQNDPSAAWHQLKASAEQCLRNGWHIQLFTKADIIAALAEKLEGLPVPVVLDHFGLLSPSEPDSAAEQAIVRLLELGKAWVKFSGTYRLDPPDLGPETMALARRLYAANPEQIVWGSDWPHTPPHPGSAANSDVTLPYRDLDDRALLNTVKYWFDNPYQWQQILATNPARLYGFEPPDSLVDCRG